MPLGLSCPLVGRSVAMWVGPSYFPRDRKLNFDAPIVALVLFTSVVTLVSAVTLWLPFIQITFLGDRGLLMLRHLLWF